MARRSVKKNIISLVSGLTVVGGTIATSVVLLNMIYKGTTTFAIQYSNLNKMYETILNTYGVNSNNSPLTINEFKSKVEDGNIKKWILDNYKNYFISDNNENELNFTLSFSDNTLIFTPMSKIKFNLNYDGSELNSKLELKDNKIYIHFDNSDFIQTQYFSFFTFDSFKMKLVEEMQKRKIVFSDFISANDEQKIQIKNWIISLFNIGDIFETVEFDAYTITNKSNLYSLKLKPTKNYIFSWNSGNSNNDEYQVFKNEIIINFTKTITLNQNILSSLFEKVNDFIWNQRIDYFVWVEHFKQKDHKYNEFKEFIYNELNNLLNNELDSIDAIGDLSLSNDKGIFSLNISSSNGYNFVSNSSYFNNGMIVLSNLEFYRFIKFSPINFTNFFESLQNYVFNNKYTIQEFTNWFNEDSFKQFISQNLYNSSGELINSDLIGNVTFDSINNLIEITPATMYQFEQLSSTRNLSINNNGNIVISNLEYYTLINLTKLDALFDAIQDLISKEQFTSLEFENYLSNNLSRIKSLIASNLYVDSSSLIEFSQIKNVSYQDGNLLIDLTPPTNKKYEADANNNVVLNTNTLKISNLVYYKITNLTNLNTLHQSIQNVISINKLTNFEFQQYIEDNQSDLINLISNNLYTSNNSKLPVEQINSVSYINENLRIDLNPPENVKYSIDNSSDVSLSNNIITVSNFTYFTDVKLTKLDVLYNAIQNFIVNKMFTSSEFETYINENLEDVKRLISNNLFISNVSTISETLIESVSYENNRIKVILSVPNNIKYSVVSYANATLNDNILSISNLQFFTTNLLNPTNLQNAIQNAIDTQKATTDEFNDYVNSNQIAFKTLVANNISGLNSSSQISNIRFNNSVIEINLTSSAYTKFAMSNSNANVQLSNNLMTVSGLRYFSDTSLLNLNNLYNSVQDLISSERLTLSEFITYVNKNQSKLKDLVSNNLWVANNVTISSTEIANIEFTGNSLNIWISPRSFTKYNLANDINWSFENNILSLKNFTYYSIVELVRLDDLYNSIQNKITSSKYTISEFQNYVQNQQNDIKTLVSNNLYLSQTTLLGSDKVSNVSFSEESLKITLNPPTNIKYSVSLNDNWMLKDNILTLKNFTYFTITNLVKFSSLFNALQSLITTQKLTSIELSTYINQNQTSVKELISDSLYISQYSKIGINEIGAVSADSSGVITVNLTAPNNIKYNSEQNTNVSFNSTNNKLTISNFQFFTAYTVTQAMLDNFKNAFRTYVQNSHLRTNDLNISNVQNLINSNFNIPISNFNASISGSDGVANLTISPVGRVKFISSVIPISDNNLIINNLQTVKYINIGYDSWRYVVESTQSFIDTYKISNASSFNTNEALFKSFFSKGFLDNDKNYIPSNAIGGCSMSGTTVTINSNLNDYYYFYGYSNIPSNLQNISYINGSIKIINMKFYSATTAVTPSPDNWFKRQGNKIIGLSPLGKTKSNFVLPSWANEVSDDLFFENNLLVTLDMSLTKITSIPSGQFIGSSGYESGFAMECKNLVSLVLPNNLTIIGDRAFDLCNNLTRIVFPNTLNVIGQWSLSYIGISGTLDLSSTNLNNIQYCAFYGNNVAEIILPSTIRTIGQSAFISNTYLRKINIPYGTLSIYTNAFRNCTSLTELDIPNTVTRIDKDAFSLLDNTLKITIHSQSVKNLVVNSGFKGTVTLV